MKFCREKLEKIEFKMKFDQKNSNFWRKKVFTETYVIFMFTTVTLSQVFVEI